MGELVDHLGFVERQVMLTLIPSLRARGEDMLTLTLSLRARGEVLRAG